MYILKISKIKVGIFFIVVATILIETITISAYEITKKSDIEEMKNKIESETVEMSTDARKTLDLINEYRNQNGLESLKPYSELQKVAEIKAEDLELNNYFEHNSENLGTPFEMLHANSVDYRIAGENLAGNTTPERAVEAWINSPTHRDNILEERFEYTGIYVIDSEVYGKIFVQLFIGID